MLGMVLVRSTNCTIKCLCVRGRERKRKRKRKRKRERERERKKERDKRAILHVEKSKKGKF